MSSNDKSYNLKSTNDGVFPFSINAQVYI